MSLFRKIRLYLSSFCKNVDFLWHRYLVLDKSKIVILFVWKSPIKSYLCTKFEFESWKWSFAEKLSNSAKNSLNIWGLSSKASEKRTNLGLTKFGRLIHMDKRWSQKWCSTSKGRRVRCLIVLLYQFRDFTSITAGHRWTFIITRSIIFWEGIDCSELRSQSETRFRVRLCRSRSSKKKFCGVGIEMKIFSESKSELNQRKFYMDE
jgi:hypothetical protein